MRFQPITYSNTGPIYNRAFITCLEYLNGRLRMEKEYRDTLKKFEKMEEVGDPTPYFDVALDQIDITYKAVQGDIKNIPKKGPLIVLANHPFGIVDGLITGSIVHKQRQDLRILANHALQKAEPMQKWLIPLDDAGTKAAEAANRPAIIKAMRYLHKGGCLCIFPAGRVARPSRWGTQIDDYQWQEFAARMILSARKIDIDLNVVPIFFDGQNSSLFHFSHIIRFMAMRRALIVSEALKKQGQTISVHIGQPHSVNDLPDAPSAKELTDILRKMVFDLQPAPAYFPKSYAPKALPNPINS